MLIGLSFGKLILEGLGRSECQMARERATNSVNKQGDVGKVRGIYVIRWDHCKAMPFLVVFEILERNTPLENAICFFFFFFPVFLTIIIHQYIATIFLIPASNPSSLHLNRMEFINTMIFNIRPQIEFLLIDFFEMVH